MTLSSTADRATWLRLAALGIVAVALSGFFGWQSGEMVVAPLTAPAPPKWALPTHAKDNPERDMAALAARNPWVNPLAKEGRAGAVGNSGAAGAAAPTWRLAGIVERGGDKFVLIAVGPPHGAAKFEYRRIGDSLPDGSTLVAVTADSAVTEVGDAEGKRRVYWLFRGKS